MSYNEYRVSYNEYRVSKKVTESEKESAALTQAILEHRGLAANLVNQDIKFR